MRLIQIHIEHPSKGFNLDQIKISEDRRVAIYKQTFPDTPNLERYEVIIVNSHNGYEIQGNHIEASEIYPGETMWGVLGWTCVTLERAEQKYNNLIQLLEERKFETINK